MQELDEGWQIIEGRRRILVSAGHNLQQGREGAIKPSDIGTGEVARNICERFGFWGIISTRKQMDPNWYPHSPFREKMKEIIEMEGIKAVIDIHGMSLGAETMFEFRANKRFFVKYADRLREIKIGGFTDDRQLTIGEELQEVAVMEIEIREDGRVPTIDEVKYQEAMKKLYSLMEKINED
jgi:hypothetical protein